MQLGAGATLPLSNCLTLEKLLKGKKKKSSRASVSWSVKEGSSSIYLTGLA